MTQQLELTVIEQPVTVKQTVTVTFDGGTSCNIPRLGFGDGYGSYQLDKHPVKRVKFGPMSANCAEVLTLCKALMEILESLEPAHTGLVIIGDSMIALNKARLANRKKRKKVGGTLEFQSACKLLIGLVEQFAAVECRWWPRENSVALFGH